MWRCILPIVWPSKVSRFEDFVTLIRDATFFPSQNTKVKVYVQDLLTSSFPLTQCSECVKLYSNSGIGKKLNGD